ncbi:MAG: hypothetical protein ACLUFP_08405 [Streptococcus salivarius]
MTGVKHAADSKAGALYLVQDSIAGLSDYLSGANKDFSNVGSKQSTITLLQYTLKNRNHTGTLRQPMVCSSQLTKTFLRTKGKILVSQRTQPLSL